MIVADTNLIAYLYIEGEHTAKAKKVFDKDVNWFAPSLWISEFSNVLVTYFRRRMVTLPNAIEVLQTASLHIKTYDYELIINEVLELACTSNCSAYDCHFVALAKKLDVPLITSDKQVLKNFPETAIAITDFVI